ncbi:MAG: hypothetical protein O3B31_01775 [Chloroflexi bacterium]|nr:hypothetical protein [Chloroflexota bacterium]MDA1002070.1 hypothetical protein [Chloroflexota bacterium]
MDALEPDPAEPDHLIYTGHSVIRRVHGGAVLYGTDSGVMDITAPFAAPFVTTVNIVDGTKQYAGATRQIVATGTLSLITGDAVGAYTGTIDKHAAR